MIAEGLELLRKKLEQISHNSGVYQMIGKNKEVLYVGKAKNLKKRLTSYTHIHKLSPRILQMVSSIQDVLTIETDGETKALLLENELIKKYQPPFNILLKDDKSFPYIMLTYEKFPRMMIYRGKRDKNGKFFGPFTSASSVHMTLQCLQKVFMLRTCSLNYFMHRSRPCLLFQIGLCSAPCCGKIDEEEYDKSVREVEKFMCGKESSFIDELKNKMEFFSKKERFEEAALIRDKLIALNKIRGVGESIPLFETDIIGIYKYFDKACIQVFFYRHGASGGTVFYILPDVLDISEGNILTQFLMQFYKNVSVPRKIICSVKPEKEIQDILEDLSGHRVKIKSQGFSDFQKNLISEVVQNAKKNLLQSISENWVEEKIWEKFKSLLKIDILDKVEVYDNSHFQGSFATGAMIVFNKEGFQKKLYRRYNIKEAKSNDDFGMMKEVFCRRIQKGLSENNLPSAFLIDGGLGQLSSVRQVLEENKVNIPVLSIAKGKERNAGKEVLYLLGEENNPIILERKDPLLFFIQRVRDEAHRFAIGTYRSKRQKGFIPDILMEIEGIGVKKKKNLLQHFGSVKAITGASIDDLKKVSGINEELAEKISHFFDKDLYKH